MSGGLFPWETVGNERDFIQIISPALAFNFSSITLTSTPFFLLQEILLWGLSFLHSHCRISFCSLYRGVELTDGYKNHRLFFIYKNRKTVMLKITLFSTPLKSWKHRLGRQPGSSQPSPCALRGIVRPAIKAQAHRSNTLWSDSGKTLLALSVNLCSLQPTLQE